MKKNISLVAFLVCAAIIAAQANAVPSFEWMGVFRLRDLRHYSDIITFLSKLQTAIPPLSASLEAIEYLVSGQVFWANIFATRVAFVLAFFLPLLSLNSAQRLILAPLALGLLNFAVLIHKNGIPHSYDIFIALGIVIAWQLLLYLKKLKDKPKSVLFAAGFCLACCELLRPYFGFLLFPAIAVYITALKLKPKQLITFLCPIVLLSGGWHAKMAVRHQMLSWSNHVGYNLQRSVTIYQAHIPWFFEADSWPECGPGSKPINTPEHTACSKRWTRSVAQFFIQKPGTAFFFAYSKFLHFMSIPYLGFGKIDPYVRPMGITYFRLCLKIAFYYTVCDGLLSLILGLIQRRKVVADRLFLYGLCLGSMAAFILGEDGEENRFWVSLIPLFLAALTYAAADLQRAMLHFSRFKPKAIQPQYPLNTEPAAHSELT